MRTIIAARVFATLIVGVILFQIGLIVGMPWGEFTWGGYYPGTLPTNMRLASVASAFLLLAIGLIVLIRAGFLLPAWQPFSKKLMWVVVPYCGLGVIANAITPSVWERIIWLPVAIILFAASIVVTKSR